MHILQWHCLLGIGLLAFASGCQGGDGSEGQSQGTGGQGSGGVGGDPRGTGGQGNGSSTASSDASKLGPPKSITSVKMAEADIAWPIGKWEDSLASVHIACTDGSQDIMGSPKVTITAGSGSSYNVVFTLGSISCEGTAQLSGDKDTLLATTSSCGSTYTLPLFALRPWSEGVALTTTIADMQCTAKIRNTLLDPQTGSRVTPFAKGSFEQKLDTPLALTGMAVFEVTPFGADLPETTFRKMLNVPKVELPAGLTMDTSAIAIKDPEDEQVFQVLLGFTNSGNGPIGFYPGSITSVDNSAGLPVASKPLKYSAFPGAHYSISKYLRPGQKGWLVSSFTADDSKSWNNAGQIQLTPPRTDMDYPGAGTDLGTPFRYRFSESEGVEIDVAESRASSLQVVYLDANDVPVAFDMVDSSVPTYDFPGEPTVTFYGLQPILSGRATKMAVFPDVD